MSSEISQAKYLGEWELVPELSIYQSGEPPLAGRYSLRLDGNRIEIAVNWTDQEFNPFEMHFGGPLDGERHDYEGPEVTHVSYRQVDERTLDSTAFSNDRVLLYAKRVASEDGRLLAISQTMSVEEGEATNFQVYRRVKID